MKGSTFSLGSGMAMAARLVAVLMLAMAMLATAADGRFVMYYDQYHPTRPTTPTAREGITHLILAFAQANATAAYKPHVDLATLRQEYPGVKLSVAIGGWGDTAGFTEAARSEAGMDAFAREVGEMLTRVGADGVDIDWEYPGGNGADYRQTANSAKVGEIVAFPTFLSALRKVLGNDKLISIAVPGKKEDMIAFTKETGPLIWPSVDFVNVMSYDLMNRRDTTTAHHTSIHGAAQSIQNYLAIGAPPSKLNLGFAYYAKYFTIAPSSSCSATQALNCTITAAEDPVTGADTKTSGAWTFEKAHMQPVDGKSLTSSTDGTCGPDKRTRCATGCCSQYGNCGTSVDHCSGACQHAFGTGCTDPDIAGSWQLAAANAVEDSEEGGEYYYDAANRLFWTWDTPALIARKIEEIVGKEQLGGIMAWSLGEDSNDWSHIQAMAQGLARLKGGVSSESTSSFSDNAAPPQQPESSDSPSTAGFGSQLITDPKFTQPDLRPKPHKPKPKPDYKTVHVDGIGGPTAEESDIPLPQPPKKATTHQSKNANSKNAAAVVSVKGPSAEKVKMTGSRAGAGARKDAAAAAADTDVEPGPNDDWEWVWFDENGKPWQSERGRLRRVRL